jgi:fatty acid desaturase
VAGLLENALIWRGLGWLCLVIVSLWLITVLFPTPEGPNERAPKDHTVAKAHEDETPP